MKRILLALCLSINGLSHAQQPAAEPHTFTATDGRKLTATIVGKTDTTVTIRRAEDGQEFVLPLDRISAADQAFVKTWGTKPVPPTAMPPANSTAVKEITVETPEGKVDLEIWVVEPKWDDVIPYRSEKNHLKLIFASRDGAMFMIYPDGREIRSKTLLAGDYPQHFGGPYWVTTRGGLRDGKDGLFNAEDDAFCIEPVWGKLVWSSYSEEFEAGVIWARKEPEGPEWVILDFAGNEKKRVEGLPPFKHLSGPRVSRPDGKTTGSGTLISVVGEKLADWPWESYYDYHDGYLAVRGMANGEENWGFVDQEGTIVLPAKWHYFPRVPQAEWGKPRSFVTTFEAFPSGLAAVAVGGKFEPGARWLGGKRGFLNKAGELVIPAIWDDTYGFRDGIALVLKDGLWGIISTTGEVLAEPQWEEALPLSMRRVWIRKGDKWGMADESGAVLGKVEWDCWETGFIDDFWHGLLRVKKDGETVQLKPDGSQFTEPPGISNSFGFINGVALASETDSGQWVLIDPSGKRLYQFPDGIEFDRDAGPSSSSKAYIEKDGKKGAIIITPK